MKVKYFKTNLVTLENQIRAINLKKPRMKDSILVEKNLQISTSIVISLLVFALTDFSGTLEVSKVHL